MSEESQASMSVESKPGPGAGHGAERGGQPPLLDPSGTLMAWTWVSFAIVAIVLYKTAWKPITKALNDREGSIRDALAGAEKARAELAEVEARSRKLLAEAQAKGQEIVASARESAGQLAESIRKQAEADSKAAVDDARRQIDSAVEKARGNLSRETARLAIDLAGQVVRQNMDSTANRALVDKLVEEV